MSVRPYQMNASLVVDIYFLALYPNRTLDISVFRVKIHNILYCRHCLYISVLKLHQYREE